MPYDERTINELQESADMTPVGIQLEVNTDIFNTCLLYTSPSPRD